MCIAGWEDENGPGVFSESPMPTYSAGCYADAMNLKAPILIGIAGGSGSGKTTICQRIEQSLGQDCLTLSCDHYYRSQNHLTEEQRAEVNYDHPDTLDLLLLQQQLSQLKSGQRIELPQYCFSTHTRQSHSVELSPSSVVLVEGILIFTSIELRRNLDLLIFVDAPNEVRFHRRLQRDTSERGRTASSVRRQWDRTVAPMYDQFVEPAKKLSDLIVNTERDNRQTLQILVAGIKALAEQ